MQVLTNTSQTRANAKQPQQRQSSPVPGTKQSLSTVSVTQLGCTNGEMFRGKCHTKDKCRRDCCVCVWWQQIKLYARCKHAKTAHPLWLASVDAKPHAKPKQREGAGSLTLQNIIKTVYVHANKQIKSIQPWHSSPASKTSASGSNEKMAGATGWRRGAVGDNSATTTELKNGRWMAAGETSKA